ncbi:hypothetical protein PQX77_002644 [Marasmius sp. AFHP31]|nr:hypothetical protein PQX77_002644 [Marasmius sp. AFHP31]
MRHDRTPKSASEVLEHVFTLVPRRSVQLQEEIRLEGKRLEQTAAGFVQREELERMIAKHQQSLAELREEMDALKNENVELTRELEQERAELKQKVARWESEKAELHRSQLGKQMKIRLFADEKKVTQVMELGPVSPPPPYEVARYSPSTFRREDLEFAYSDRYPPYMKKIPRKDRKCITGIFDFESLLQTTVMLSLCSQLFPKIRELAPSASVIRSIDDLVRRNRELHDKARVGGGHSVDHSMYLKKNIGLREDWYSDALFGQQQFTGTNSTTITRADRRWVEEYLQVSRNQRRRDVSQLLENDSDNLFVQDYSDFRASMNLSETTKLMTPEGRYGCASVVLFHLEAGGQLHPLAITLDYQGSMDNSVTIFNRRIGYGSSGDEYTDWPWRYAKMCAQVSDWLRHEVAIHLVHTHLVEEVLIVAANRVFDPEHVVLRLLEPHWATTLALNKAARETLVPKIIVKMTGFSEVQTYAFLKNSYRKFNWTELYVPNDLRNRGFPVERLGERKYHNYGYARNISRLWEILRKFVCEVLTEIYGGDEQVRRDGSITSFCREVRSSYGGQLSSFPDISTLDELIDFVTMCIHIASPQHNAVNYLQQYYQTFVPNKPSALYTPLPRTLSELNRIGEKDILAALPLHRPKDWLLMSQVPYLLSFEVEEDQTILCYAKTALNSSSEGAIRRAAGGLQHDLQNFIPTCRRFNEDLDDGEKTPYDVLNPEKTALSILI